MDGSADDDREFKGRMSELEKLLQQIEAIRDTAARELTGRVIQSLMDFHGAGIARLLQHLDRAAIDELARDELVSSLLLLYGLHPDDVKTRVRRALDGVRPYLASHGGSVELLGISEGGSVQLQMHGSCHGCPSSTATLRNLIESAVFDAAPEIVAVELAGSEEVSTTPAAPGFVPLENVVVHRAATVFQ